MHALPIYDFLTELSTAPSYHRIKSCIHLLLWPWTSSKVVRGILGEETSHLLWDSSFKPVPSAWPCEVIQMPLMKDTSTMLFMKSKSMPREYWVSICWWRMHDIMLRFLLFVKMWLSWQRNVVRYVCQAIQMHMLRRHIRWGWSVWCVHQRHFQGIWPTRLRLRTLPTVCLQPKWNTKSGRSMLKGRI